MTLGGYFFKYSYGGVGVSFSVGGIQVNNVLVPILWNIIQGLLLRRLGEWYKPCYLNYCQTTIDWHEVCALATAWTGQAPAHQSESQN